MSDWQEGIRQGHALNTQTINTGPYPTHFLTPNRTPIRGRIISMKRILAPILIALTFSVMLPSTSFSCWTEVLEDGVGNTYYVDFERIRKAEGHIYVWSLLDRDKPNHVGYFSTQVYRKIDCTLSRFKILSYSFHEAGMGRGNGTPLITKSPVWVYPPSNSSTELILKSICSR